MEEKASIRNFEKVESKKESIARYKEIVDMLKKDVIQEIEKCEKRVAKITADISKYQLKISEE